ncbi:phosphocholine cytidylyltransferase family protein [Desulforhopalus sp. 52FAK]
MQNRTFYTDLADEQVRTALLLAAGTGSRLAPLTDSMPKCMVEVNEITILERLISTLQDHDFNRLVVVVGHQGESIRNYLGARKGGMDITYITSPLYKTTNNIYSLWLAREEIDEPFLLIESDLVFDSEMLTNMLSPDRIAVAKIEPWMNGTTVTLNNHMEIEAFHSAPLSPDEEYFKTVNIYSFSLSSWQLVKQRLDQYISNNQVDGYYETVFADLVKDRCLIFTPVFFDNKSWYEIDTITDLREAELIFTSLQLPAFDATAVGEGSSKIKVPLPMAPTSNLLQ